MRMIKNIMFIIMMIVAVFIALIGGEKLCLLMLAVTAYVGMNKVEAADREKAAEGV